MAPARSTSWSQRAKSLGMNGLALTDHGNLHGALEFYQACKKEGINPILGYEAYIAPDSRLKRDAGSLKEASYHLTLLAQNRTGFRNLIKLASKAYLEGFYFKPRVDRELLEEFHEGIICLSGCVSSEFSRAILKGAGSDQKDLDEAKEIAAWFHQLFGDRYFIEIQNNGARNSATADGRGGRSGPPHGHSAGGYERRPLCQSGRFRCPGRAAVHQHGQISHRYESAADGYESVLSCAARSEMYAAFPGFDEALKQSQVIADSVNIELELGQRHFPNFDAAGNQNADRLSARALHQGLA